MISKYALLSLILLISVFSVSAQSLDVLEDSISIEMSQSNTETRIINIKNTGTAPIEVQFDISQLSLKDNDGDEITVSFSDPGIIDPNQTKQSTLTATTPNQIDFESFGGTVKVRIINTTVQDTFTLTINVIPDVCDFGQVGSALKLDIEDPDEGDDFSPGDRMNIKLNVENNGPVDIRTQGEAFLFTEGGREIESCASEVLNIEDGEDEDFQCTIVIPVDSQDIEEDEDLKLFVKAFDDDNEASQCSQKSIPINIDIESKKLIIDERNTRFMPHSVSCGDITLANVQIVNIGEKRNEATILISNRELNINLKSDLIKIEGFGSEERNTQSRQFEIQVPENAKNKEYRFDVKVNFEGGTATSLIPLDVISCEAESGFIIQDFSTEALVKPLEDKFSVKPGGFLSIPIDITSNLNRQTIFIVSVKNIGDFAEASSKQVFLQPGQRITTFLEMLIKDDIEPSVYSGVIEVRAGQNVVFSSPINIEVQEPVKQSKAKEAFSRIPLWFWIIVNIALIGLVLISIKIITNSKQKFNKSTFKRN